MKIDGVRKLVRAGGMFLGLIVCFIFSSTSITAQSAGDPAKAQMQEMNQREMQLNNLGEKALPRDPKRTQAMMDQVSEDFQRILTLHNEIVRAVGANQTLSNKFLSDAMGEIRKRSARLQSSLKLERLEVGPDNQKAAPDLSLMATKDQMLLLCKQIENFVRNPIIEKPGTVDAQQLQKARKDLQSVVELSDTIKKQVDKQRP